MGFEKPSPGALLIGVAISSIYYLLITVLHQLVVVSSLFCDQQLMWKVHSHQYHYCHCHYHRHEDLVL